MARKIRYFSTALAALTTIGGSGLAASSPAAAQTPPAAPPTTFPQVDPAAPLLWSGVLRNSAGVPSAGKILAYVQSNPGPEDAPATQQIPLGSLEVGSDGHFQLRAAYRPEFDALVDRSGNLLIMTVATTVTGEQTLGLATLKWVGKWIDPIKAATTAETIQSFAEGNEGVSYDMATPSNQTNPPAIQSFGDDVGAYPFDGCRYADPVGGLPGISPYHPYLEKDKQFVAIQRMANLTGFGKVTNTYSRTESTSAETIVSTGAELFVASGSIQLGNNVKETQGMKGEGFLEGSVNGPQVKKWYIYTSRRISKFLCGGGVQGPFRTYTTVHPYNWEGGWGSVAAIPMPLSYRRDMCDPIGSNGKLTRSGGASTEISASWDAKIGQDFGKDKFGKATVGITSKNTSTDASEVTTEWANSSPQFEKYVCGDVGVPSRDKTDSIMVPNLS